MSKTHDLDQHGKFAWYGIVVGMSLLFFTAWKCYLTWVPNRGCGWAWGVIPALIALAWGCSHLAKHRGYPAAVAYGLVLAGPPFSVGIAIRQSPITVGIAVIFLGVMPLTLLLALPKRFGALRRK